MPEIRLGLTFGFFFFFFKLWLTVLLEKMRYLSINIPASLIVTFTSHKNVMFENNFYFRSSQFMRIPEYV